MDSEQELVPLTKEEAAQQVNIKPMPQSSRLIVVETVYYQPMEGQPTTMLGEQGHRFVRQLDSDEEPYQRKKVATLEWQPLDRGWIETECSCLLIRNDLPSLDETPDPNNVIEVSFNTCADDGVLLIYPDESLRVCLLKLSSLRIRGRSEGLRYTLAIIPK